MSFLTALSPVCTLPLWRSLGAACVDLWRELTVVKPAVSVTLPAGMLDSLFSLQDSYDGVALHTLLHCSTVLFLSQPENHVPSGSPQVLTSLLQVSAMSDFQPYMDKFVTHLQESDASALRNSVVIEQVLRLPTHGPHLVGPFLLYFAVCFSAGM